MAIALAGDFRSDAPPLNINRAEAEAIAGTALNERGVALGGNWQRFAATRLRSQAPAAASERRRPRCREAMPCGG